jgi:hypothetical protein
VTACAKYRVSRTGEAAPDYPYRVVRTLPDKSIEILQYADTRAEAVAIAKQANEGLVGKALSAQPKVKPDPKHGLPHG